MVRRRKSSLLLFLCLQAMAVAIICLGSLINFHQYKIWGKPLIPNFVGYKRDIEKYSKTLAFSKSGAEHSHLHKNFGGGESDFTFEMFRLQSRSAAIITFGLTEPVPFSKRVSSCGLRGPPIS